MLTSYSFLDSSNHEEEFSNVGGRKWVRRVLGEVVLNGGMKCRDRRNGDGRDGYES